MSSKKAIILGGALSIVSMTIHASERLSITPAPISERIRLDGVLDESGWESATATRLTQQSPSPGATTPFLTSVQVLADRFNLYFGFTCVDPHPGAIAIHTMQRDGDMDGDDSVAITLDTFGDQRSGYYFRVNAAGARADGLVASPEDVPLDWDGVWEARARRTPNGWTAEIAIPIATLRFTPSLREWGFNLERYVARDRLTLRWSGTTLDARLADFRRSGFLAVPGFQRGAGLTANVNSVARRDSDFALRHRTLTGKIGADVGYNTTPQLGAVITVNTDFAETEVDTRQINLTQFPLFFPEKRTFFLEGSNQFRFGLNLGSDFVPFYSRRIGLVAGDIVPLTVGFKILGRTGRWGIAALDVETGSLHGLARRNLFAGRVTYDVDDHLRVGTLVTNGDPAAETESRFGGVDATWTTSTLFGDKNFAAGAWAGASRTDHRGGRPNGWGVAVDYPNDLWDINASVKVFGDVLDPTLGFLPRPGTRQSNAYVAYQPRPHHSWIRQHFFELQPRLVEDWSGRVLSWRFFTAPFNVRTTGGAHLEANYAPEFQRLLEPFAIAEGVTIPPGRYRFDRFRVEGQSSSDRPIRIGTTIWFGEFFDGRLTQLSSFINWTKTDGRLQLELEAENDFGRLPFGNFAQRLVQAKVVLAPGPDLVFSSYTQYDSETRQVAINNRVRWTLRPTAELFAVWNRGWIHRLGDNDNLAPRNDQFVVKMRWIVRR